VTGRRFVAELEASRQGVEACDLLDGDHRVRLAGAAEQLGTGDLVAVEERDGVGRVVGPSLARAGSVRASVYRIAARHRLDPFHPPEALAQAREIRRRPGTGDASLEDLTRLPFVTVDNRGSRDLDQALHLERLPGGQGYLVRYAIADASYYVRAGTPLFGEALARGATYYLPGLAIPMLPRSLCEDLVSLNQGRLRRALVFEMRVDRRGECLETRLVRALVSSRRKLTYPGVQRHYDDPAGSGMAREPWGEPLDLLREVGELLRERARRQHVVEYRRSEVEVKVGEGERASCTIVGDRRLEVERYNEQVSLLCNVEGARLLAQARGLEHVQGVFRVHPPPGSDALVGFERTVEALVRRRRLLPEVWSWRRGEEPLADYLARLPRRSRLGRALERQARMLNDPARFEPEPAPHHAIGAPFYARFSAPMREIVGVFTHKEALEALGGAAAAPPTAGDVVLREQVIDAANRARALQRQLTKDADLLALDLLLSPDLARPRPQRVVRRGTVLGLERHRLRVQLDRPTVDLKVDVADLSRSFGCGFRLDDTGVAMEPEDPQAPTYHLGDEVVLVTAGRDPDRNRWHFDLER
jgi:ribonuclease R